MFKRFLTTEVDLGRTLLNYMTAYITICSECGSYIEIYSQFKSMINELLSNITYFEIPIQNIPG